MSILHVDVCVCTCTCTCTCLYMYMYMYYKIVRVHIYMYMYYYKYTTPYSITRSESIRISTVMLSLNRLCEIYIITEIERLRAIEHV